MPGFPAHCSSCGHTFYSEDLWYDGEMRNCTFSGNAVVCPNCSQWAYAIDGVFDAANGVLRVLQAPETTFQILQELKRLSERALQEPSDGERFWTELEKVSPTLAVVLRALGLKGGTKTIVAATLLIAAVNSCNVDVTVDANRLLDQVIAISAGEVPGKEP